MPRRIKEDHKHFRDVIEGRTREELKKLIRKAKIVGMRPKGGKLVLQIPQIDIPHFVFGDDGEGLGRGPGEEGDVVGRDPQDGDGGNQAGDEDGDGIHIQVDMEYVLRLLGEDLRLPPMKPKPQDTFEEVKIRYNDISKVGVEALRHNRRTVREALKRLAASNDLENLQRVPGCKVPVNVLQFVNSDRRYRQYNEIKIPSSNAVIFFARDCSGSMDDYRCDIVSDMSWWLDCWIRQFYDRVERCYFVHDTRAIEVSEEQFYSYRYGGGTHCSSAFRAIADQLENRYPPQKYNIYIFYFTDGDNWPGDNERIEKIVTEELTPDIVNLIGVTQVCPWGWGGDTTVKEYFDKKMADDDYIRTVEIGPKGAKDASDNGYTGWGYTPDLPDRDEQIIGAIRHLLTTNEPTGS